MRFWRSARSPKWTNAFVRLASTHKIDCLEYAGCGIPTDVIRVAQTAREYRNKLVHDREVEVEPIVRLLAAQPTGMTSLPASTEINQNPPRRGMSRSTPRRSGLA